MNRIDEEEDDEEEDDDGDVLIKTVDQFPSVRPPPEYSNHYSSNDNICSSKQTSDETDRNKYQTTNRSTSLPSRPLFSSTINNEEDVKQRRRYASESSNNNNKTTTASLVTSFLQYLRSELRATTNVQKNDYRRIRKQKSREALNYLSQTFNPANNFYHQQYPIEMSSSTSSSSQSLIASNKSSDEDLLKTNFDDNNNPSNDDNEILTLINLLILRVECLANENTALVKKKRKQTIYPSIKQIDQNLIEYLYYLFNKFITDESDLNQPMIDKSSFVNICQTLVRNGCFNIPPPTSPDQSTSESTITNNSELTLTHTFGRERISNADEMRIEGPTIMEPNSMELSNDQETWLDIDLELTKPLFSVTTDRSKCSLQSSTHDDQFLLATNENYSSFEELKSCGSESSYSNYFSPNSSFVDLQNMVQESDDINNNNILFNEEGLSSIDHATNNTNVTKETKDTTSNNNIYKGLTNEQVASSSIDTTEQMTTSLNGKMSRRERKMQERWTITTKNDNEQLPTKTFLGVEFPPIAVLRRKFSTSPPPGLSPLPLKKKDSSSSFKSKILLNSPSQENIDKSNQHCTSTPSNPSDQEINTSIPTAVVDKTKHDQVLDLHLNDPSSSIICCDSKTNDDIQSLSVNVSQLLTDENSFNEDMTIKPKQELISSSLECQKESITNIDQYQQMNIDNDSSIMITDTCTSHLPSSSLLSISSSLTTNTNETETIELLVKEIEEEKKEEEHCDDDNVDAEEKNNCNVVYNYHALGTILIDDEPTQAVLLEQEKKEKEEEQETERPSSPLPTLEQCNQQRPEDVPAVQTLSKISETLIMTDIDETDQRYKTIEIEEISDDEEILSAQNNHLIEPTDYILTDDDPKTLKKSNITTNNETCFKFDPVFSCYEKTLPKTVDTIDESTKPSNLPSQEFQIPSSTKRSQCPEDDPIALRALERFEQRMNAAVAAKTGNDETKLLTARGKSSWSGTPSTPRKSLENLFDPSQSLQSTFVSTGEELIKSPRQHDTFIRPRKTMLDDMGLNFGVTVNVFDTVQNNPIDNDNHKSEEQHQPTAIVENVDKHVMSDESTKLSNYEDHEQQEQPIIINSSMTTESGLGNEVENSNSSPTPSVDSTLNTIISHSSSSEQQSFAPYRLQLEGRRRLNTLERIRERHLNYNSNESTPQQIQLQHDYNIKPEELQDPIIRRALERFDEKSRSLSQAKLPSYDEIQDPITRRALMRLDTNLKRAMPPNPPSSMIPTNNDLNETWYTNSYTLGSLQSNNDNRFLRYPDSSVPPTFNPKPSHVSIHQRFSSTSSADMADLSPHYINPNNENDIPIMRVPAQPIYVSSNNQPQQPINVRQRSRSEDMLSSRDLCIGQTTNLDDISPTQLQRNHSSDDLQQQETLVTNETIANETDFQLPNTIIKSLDPNFIRTTEASVNYATPTQTYTGYSCEYTRPHQNQLVTSPKSELSSPKNSQQQQQPQQENGIQYPPPPSSAFTPVHPSINNYYPQQPLPTPSYNPMYTTNNPNQTPYSDDPIVRRALERFNSQMQSSFMTMPQQPPPPNMNYMSRQFPNGYPRQENVGSFYPVEPNQYDPWAANSHRPQPPTSNTNTGYQSIIGRRRQMRHDEIYHDIGNGYSTLMNPQNAYPMANPYMNFPDEPPMIPPRLHRDFYHEQQQQEYLTENINNNNNNNNHPFIHHAYPATTNGFRPINYQYIPSDSFHQLQEDEYLRHRAQSTSSTTSSESLHPIRLIHQRLPPTAVRTNIQQNNSQLPSGEVTPSNGNTTEDSVFHRLAYTATKSSLSKSSSNLCANLAIKNPPQPPQQTKPNNFKTEEIEDDDSTNIENNQESQLTSANILSKCQRSRSVDGRARLKNAQARMHNNNNQARPTNDYDDNNSSTVPSSKFTPINPRRDAPPPRVPVTPRSMIPDRPSITKRLPNGNNLTYAKSANGMRARNSNGNLIDTENDEGYNDNYQPKILDNKPRTSIPVNRYTANTNTIQTSASTSAIANTNSRTKLPIPISANLDKKESNASSTDLHRSVKRSDDNRVVSPNGQRRTIPVSVFAPAKLENKRPAPPIPTSSASPTSETTTSNNNESQQDEHQQQPLSHSSTGDSSYSTINNENEMKTKLSTTNSSLKSSTGNLLNEFSLTHDKHETNKKMNVFERLFRGHKKKA